MEKKYFKMVAILKKKPGISFEDFKAHYEGNHMTLAKQYMTKLQQHNYRKYLLPVDAGAIPEDRSEDVILEIWFNSREDLDTTMKSYTDNPEMYEIFSKDEEKFFDRTKMRFYILDECHNDFESGGHN